MGRPYYTWQLRTRSLELGRRTLVMGILNVTPDSFSDGGKFLVRDHAVAHALKMFDDGADLLDIGGESTRPGVPVAESGIPAAEELRRIMPVIEDVLRERPGTLLSVDTYKAEVARAAVGSGRVGTCARITAVGRMEQPSCPGSGAEDSAFHAGRRARAAGIIRDARGSRGAEQSSHRAIWPHAFT